MLEFLASEPDDLGQLNLPDTRVICIPLYDKVAWSIICSGRHDHHITPLRILRTDDGILVGFAEATVEDLHVVAVEMNLESDKSGSKTAPSHAREQI